MARRNRRGALTLLLCASFSLGACIKTTEQPNLQGQDVHLTIIHTADLHSRIFPYQYAPGQIDKGLGLLPKHGDVAVVGGAARIATVIKQIRASSDRVIHVDSGDIFEGAPVFNLFNGEPEMRFMTGIGLSAMALGNHEFDKGPVNLELQKAKFGGFPILAANYEFVDPSDPTQPKLRDVISPFTIVNAQGLRVGIIGFGNLSSLDTIIEGGNSLGIRPVTLIDPNDPSQGPLRDLVRLIRPQVDVLVILSHLGLDEDEQAAQTDMNATGDQNAQAAIDGVDVIFGGHLHIVLNPPKELERTDSQGNPAGSTILCHSGAFGKYVGRLDLVVHVADPKVAGDKSHVQSYTYNLIPIDDSIPEDAPTANMLEPYQLYVNQNLNLTQNYAVIPCDNTQSTCPKVLRNDPDGGDSQLGNLVADSMRLRKRVEADFGLTNSLGIRADFESGPLNLEEMYNVFPFDNTITTLYLSGDEIQRTLDFVAAKSAARGCKTQAQVSGIWFILDCQQNIACGPYDYQGNLAHGCHADDRSQDGPVLIGDKCTYNLDGTTAQTDPGRCKKVIPQGSYRAAVNDYIAAGGSGFAVLKNNTTKYNTGISLRDALTDYIRNIPVQYPGAGAKCDPMSNSNIIFNGPDITESPKTCSGGDQPTTDMECGPGHVCGVDPTRGGDTTLYCLRHYDYSSLPCLNFDIQAHDGRIGHNQ